MIDTDKYEGHTKGPWIATDFEQLPFLMNKANEKLIHDAPDLLAEVKRLREGIEKALIPTDTVPWAHELFKLSGLRDALKELIE